MAAREPAQYSDYELTNSLFNAGKTATCAEEGPYEDYDCEPLAGKLQTWYGCGEDGATVYTWPPTQRAESACSLWSQESPRRPTARP